jgi:hypothetical protein
LTTHWIDQLPSGVLVEEERQQLLVLGLPVDSSPFVDYSTGELEQD